MLLPSQQTSSRAERLGRAFYDAAFGGADACPFCGAPIERTDGEDAWLGIPAGYPLECECIVAVEREAEAMRMQEREDRGYAMRLRASEIPERYYGARTDLDATGSHFIYGPAGTGKTYAACALLIEQLRNGKTVLFTSMDRVYNAGYERREQMLQAMQEIDVLCIDDMGRDETNPWADNILFRAIDHRYAWNKQLVITSNYAPSELANRIAARSDTAAAKATVDRLCGKGRGMCQPVRMEARHEAR